MKNKIGNLSRYQIFFLLVNTVLVAAFLLVTLYSREVVKTLYSQQEAGRWGGNGNSYAQVSAFLSPEQRMQKENVSQIRGSIMETLSQDAMNVAEGNGRVWIDAYSGECDTEVRKDNNTLSVTAVGVGGDFFQFHPMRLLSGSYISEEDLNRDRIVIDQGLAWAMFGSNDVIGMQLWMGNRIYVVAGVVAVEEDELTETAYGTGNRLYMPYDELKGQQESLNVTCYEAVLPNPISNYAWNTLKKACGWQEDEETEFSGEKNPLNFEGVEVMENSNRYETVSLLKKIKNLKLRSMRTNSVEYPYWENVARVVEEQQMLLLIIRILLLVVPCISVIWLVYHLWTHKSWTVKGIAVWLYEKVQEKIQEMRDEKDAELEIDKSEAGDKDTEEDAEIDDECVQHTSLDEDSEDYVGEM